MQHLELHLSFSRNVSESARFDSTDEYAPIRTLYVNRADLKKLGFTVPSSQPLEIRLILK